MVSLRRLVAVALGAVLVNEASSASLGKHLKVLSKLEIMAQMTQESAVKTVLGMNKTRNTPELASFLQQALGESGTANHSALLQTGLRGSQTGPTTGYASIKKATDMLNSMMEETEKGLETEELRCQSLDTQSLRQLDTLRDAVRTFNAKAAAARGEVVRAQGEITTAETNLVTTTENFEAHKKECEKELEELNAELKIVEDDIEVVVLILSLIDCDTKLLLVQCPHCDDAIMLQHAPIQKMLTKVKSQTAREYIQNAIGVTYATSFAQDDLRGPVNVSDEPMAVQPFDCQPTNKCSLATNPNCMDLKEKFLNVHAGILDKKDDLDENIKNKQDYCATQTRSYTTQIDSLNSKLADERANLATGTQDQNNAESGSHQKSAQHGEQATAYTKNMQECCNNQNNAKNEICALKKIRGELSKMKGADVFIIDCDVSDWIEEECSATCGGGTMKKTRTVITTPEEGGMACPPLDLVVSCNDEVCPTDCEMTEWSGWSSCSAECGGGVLERNRETVVPAAHGGEPCEELEEEMACNIQSCDVKCELSQWSSWSTCTKACDGGTQKRTKGIRIPAKGEGKCWEEDDDERLEFKNCNEFNCQEMLNRQGRETLWCNSEVDVVIVMDGSGSLGSKGWKQSTRVAEKLVRLLNGTGTRVAFELFSGPFSSQKLNLCTGRKRGTPNMKDDCGIEWISHFTDNTDELAEKVKFGTLTWPRKSTLTSVALGQAEAELMTGREEANSIVIVITDGWPMSRRNTRVAARKLEKKAKVVWIPVGPWAPFGYIKSIAQKPWRDHIIRVRAFNDLDNSDTLNRIISGTCPIVA